MKKVEIGLKEIVIFCIIWAISWGICFYIREIAIDKALLFLEVMIAFPFTIAMIYIFIAYSKNIAIELKNKANKKEIKECFISLLCILFLLLVLIWPYGPICKDLFEGPKEIVLYSVKLTKDTGGYRDYVDNYYISGITKDKEQVKIEFKPYRQSIKEVESLIKNEICLRIIYYENTRNSYQLEEGELEYELYKPEIDIIDVPNINIK